jgi:hypothetical protein
MTQITRLSLIFAAAAVAIVATPVPGHAQYSPDASASLGAGYGATALGQSTLSGTRQVGQPTKGSDELSPTMKRYCAQWPNEGVCRAARERAAQTAPAKIPPQPGR